MQCEICGKETGRGIRIVLDGSHLRVCEGCSGYGKRETMPPAFSKPQYQKTQSILEMGDEIIAGYGKAVRQAREQQGLTIEELGKRVFEKASFLHRIEAETVKPSQQLAKKLEDALNIRIIESGQ